MLRFVLVLAHIHSASVQFSSVLFHISSVIQHKGPVELIKRVKIAHSFLQSVSDQFLVIILSLPI